MVPSMALRVGNFSTRIPHRHSTAEANEIALDLKAAEVAYRCSTSGGRGMSMACPGTEPCFGSTGREVQGALDRCKECTPEWGMRIDPPPP